MRTPLLTESHSACRTAALGSSWAGEGWPWMRQRVSLGPERRVVCPTKGCLAGYEPALERIPCISNWEAGECSTETSWTRNANRRVEQARMMSRGSEKDVQAIGGDIDFLQQSGRI